jgi:hypothetical protein
VAIEALVKVDPAAGTPVVGAPLLNPISYQESAVLLVPPSIEAVVARPIGPGAVRSTTTSALKLDGESATGLKSARACEKAQMIIARTSEEDRNEGCIKYIGSVGSLLLLLTNRGATVA